VHANPTAAGNNGPKATPAYPAAYPEVIAVTAVAAKDQRYAQANRGSYIAFAAPEVDVPAPVEKGKHSYLSGTSFATAYVSGIVALLLERNRALDTGAVVDLMTAGAEDLGTRGARRGLRRRPCQCFSGIKGPGTNERGHPLRARLWFEHSGGSQGAIR
jgi:subtilisin family serine protease